MSSSNESIKHLNLTDARNAAIKLIQAIDDLSPGGYLGTIREELMESYRKLRDGELTRSSVHTHLREMFPDYYAPLPDMLYEINCEPMAKLKEQIVAYLAEHGPKGQIYSRTTGRNFLSYGVTVDGEQHDVALNQIPVSIDDIEAYLECWLQCNGGHSKRQMSLEQAQRHIELTEVVAASKSYDDVAVAATGQLYVADTSGQTGWLYKTPYFVHTNVPNRHADVATMIENLHEFYDEIFAADGMKLRVIYLTRD